GGERASGEQYQSGKESPTATHHYRPPLKEIEFFGRRTYYHNVADVDKSTTIGGSARARDARRDRRGLRAAPDDGGAHGICRADQGALRARRHLRHRQPHFE